MLLLQKSRFVSFMGHNLLIILYDSYITIPIYDMDQIIWSDHSGPCIVNLRLVVLTFTILKSHVESDQSEKMKVDGHISCIKFINRIQIPRTVQIQIKTDFALKTVHISFKRPFKIRFQEKTLLFVRTV